MYKTILLLLLPLFAQAQSTEPMLTLNTEMHTAKISRISTDSRGRYLLTASHDKTAKLWDIATGRLLRTFRPPIGTGNVGMLYAGAISADGRIVAVGGWSNPSNHDVYLFDAQTGILLQRLGGMPNVIFDLEFSPNGRYLAVAIGAGQGIRVYSNDGAEANNLIFNSTPFMEDKNYGGDIQNTAFDTWGRFATVCFDGYIRLYNANLVLLKKVASTVGKLPFSIAFSPNGKLLAIGYEDNPAVQVFDAASLTLLYSPDVSGTDSENRLEVLAFSSDGNYLAGGNGYMLSKNGQWWRQIRVWNQAGKGTYSNFDGSSDGIMDIKALPSGNFVFCSSQPEWGIINTAAGERSRYVGAMINDYYSNDPEIFHLGSGGQEVGITPYLKTALQFKLPGRQFLKEASLMPTARTEGNGLTITNSRHTTTPMLNGKAFSFLDKYEMSRCVDIATGGQGVVLGADWDIYCSDPEGNQQWVALIQATPWSIKIDDLNQVVVAALADGTIRWYRFRDGKPLLTLFLHPDNERWILWTPSGYYDASPGAEDLIGWHVNNGPDHEANYYPASKFRETYYRPDVIDLILETLDESLALRQANLNAGRSNSIALRSITSQLPPTVRILSPGADTEVRNTSLTVSYTIESPNGEAITNVRLQVDGRPVASESSYAPGQKSTITIPSANCVVSVIAENRFGASDPATVRVRWAGNATSLPQPGADLRPVLYVLAVGISQYTNPDVPDLDFAAKDARDFAAAVALQKGQLFRDVQLKVLTDGNATKDNILDGLDWLQKQTTSRDVAFLYFAGHGVDDNAQNFFFLPVGTDPAALRRTCVAHGDVQSTVASVPGKIVVFMDACHSGGLMKAINPNRRNLTPDVAKVVNELISAENGGVVFCSATSRQYALEDAKWGNGAFTKALVEGMTGKAKAEGTDKITLKSLDIYVSERVKQLTGGEQSPTTVYSVDVPDFPIGIIKF